jgi:hypothetical protein
MAIILSGFRIDNGGSPLHFCLPPDKLKRKINFCFESNGTVPPVKKGA